MIRECLRFFWRRDCDSACVLIIELAEYLDNHYLAEMSCYLKCLRENRERKL